MSKLCHSGGNRGISNFWPRHPEAELTAGYNRLSFKNLKTLEDAGITIAAGTDAGNIGTIHGPALFREFQLMKQAGLTPTQILQCATSNAAQLFGGETGAHIGRIEKGYFADLVVLNSNPADDIAHGSDIESVMKNGVLYSANNLLTAPAP
jgi:imidazolonepropionase-like amidohydrolase